MIIMCCLNTDAKGLSYNAEILMVILAFGASPSQPKTQVVIIVSTMLIHLYSMNALKVYIPRSLCPTDNILFYISSHRLYTLLCHFHYC